MPFVIPRKLWRTALCNLILPGNYLPFPHPHFWKGGKPPHLLRSEPMHTKARQTSWWTINWSFFSIHLSLAGPAWVCVNNLHTATTSFITFLRLAGHYIHWPMSLGLTQAALVVFRLLKAASVRHWPSPQKEAIWLVVGARRLSLKWSYLQHIRSLGLLRLCGRRWLGASCCRWVSAHPSVPPVGHHTLGRLLCSSIPI